MSDTLASDRLFSSAGAFDSPVVVGVLIATGAGIALGLAAAALIGRRAGERSAALAADIRLRSLTWIALAALALGPVLAGRAWAILMITAVSLLAYREFARATGLFRERRVSALVAAGILAVGFANLDHWPGLVGGVVALVPMLICVVSILKDRPSGYIQRCALGAAAFLLLGVGLGRLGGMAAMGDDDRWRAILCAVIFCCQLSDVAAYCSGKALGSGKLFPTTSPGKTTAGHVGALLVVTAVAAGLLWLLFRGTPLGEPTHIVVLSLIIAVAAQLGDLLIGSCKRDLGVKDMGASLPGHGGVLDRVNSLLLAAPAVYHYLLFFGGLDGAAPTRILTGAAP